jgi:hypothetical protein
LTHGEALELLGRLVGSARVASERSAAGELVELLGRLPLAVRLAGVVIAARPHWSFADVVSRLRSGPSRLDALTCGGLTVRGSLTRAYADLPATARRLVRLLGLVGAVDVPGWIVENLLPGQFTARRPAIEELIDRRLVDVARVDTNGPQYRVNELVLSFGRERAMAERPVPAGSAALSGP